MTVPSASNIGQQALREAFSHFPSGVAALAAIVEGERHVLVASTFTVGVSLEPPLAAFFVQKSSATWSVLSRAERIGVSILSVDHAAKCRQLASRDRLERFAGVETLSGTAGAIRIAGSAAYFECSVHGVHATGDHDVVLLLIHDHHVERETAPLVFHGSRFTRLAMGPSVGAVS